MTTNSLKVGVQRYFVFSAWFRFIILTLTITKRSLFSGQVDLAECGALSRCTKSTPYARASFFKKKTGTWSVTKSIRKRPRNGLNGHDRIFIMVVMSIHKKCSRKSHKTVVLVLHWSFLLMNHSAFHSVRMSPQRITFPIISLRSSVMEVPHLVPTYRQTPTRLQGRLCNSGCKSESHVNWGQRLWFWQGVQGISDISGHILFAWSCQRSTLLAFVILPGCQQA